MQGRMILVLFVLKNRSQKKNEKAKLECGFGCSSQNRRGAILGFNFRMQNWLRIFLGRPRRISDGSMHWWRPVRNPFF